MVVNPSRNLKAISVYLKNGTSHAIKDVTSNPIDSESRTVSFWLDDDTLAFYPLEMVASIECHFEPGE